MPPALSNSISESVSTAASQSERLAQDVAIDVAGQREGDHHRRRRQERILDVGMDAAGEIAVAGQHRDRTSDLPDRRRHGRASGPELPMQVVQP